jgi:hypothetical protein
MVISLNSFIEKVDLLTQTEIDKVRLLAFYHHSHQEDFEFSVDLVCDWFEKLGLHKPNKSRLKQNLSKSRSFVKGREQESFRLHANELKSFSIVPTLCVGTHSRRSASRVHGTQSVPEGIPMQSAGTIETSEV